jgi:hypothetical protein
MLMLNHSDSKIFNFNDRKLYIIVHFKIIDWKIRLILMHMPYH